MTSQALCGPEEVSMIIESKQRRPSRELWSALTRLQRETTGLTKLELWSVGSMRKIMATFSKTGQSEDILTFGRDGQLLHIESTKPTA